MSANDYKISKGVVYPPPPTLASDEEFSAGVSTTASPSVKQVSSKFATPIDISTATAGLASQEWVNQQILSANPTGTIIVWSTATAPNGYLMCDGSAISRTTYSNLFSVIGTTYGEGDGSTTFNLPNGHTFLYTQEDVPIGFATSTVSTGYNTVDMSKLTGQAAVYQSSNNHTTGVGSATGGSLVVRPLILDTSNLHQLYFCIKY